jgi:hypothetical protein
MSLTDGSPYLIGFVASGERLIDALAAEFGERNICAK